MKNMDYYDTIHNILQDTLYLVHSLDSVVPYAPFCQ